MQFKFVNELDKSGVLVLSVFEGQDLDGEAKKIDKKTDGILSKLIETGKFKGKKGQLTATSFPKGTSYDRIIIAGLGKKKEYDTLKAQGVGGSIGGILNKIGAKSAQIIMPDAANAAYGMKLKSYRFDKYKTKEEKGKKPTLKKAIFVCKDDKEQRKEFKRFDIIAEGVILARDIMNEPGNVIYPESLAKECEKLSELGLKVKALKRPQIKKLGMNALLAVGQGSEREERVVIMEYNGADKDKPLAFVGKGVTFDSGGISLKPSSKMDEMKFDMGGSAAVIGLMRTLAKRKAKVNAVGVIGLVENMPSGSAQRPGDIIKSMSGQTIEVLNTDAEGRLVLADILWYTNETFKPQLMINLATLTGAISVALGSHYAGLFTNSDNLADKLIKAGRKSGEKVWMLPMGEEYDKHVDSDIADVRNTGKHKEAGSITAAQFLKRFVSDTTWAHIDIAATGWCDRPTDTNPKGPLGFGVRLLDRFISEEYEK